MLFHEHFRQIAHVYKDQPAIVFGEQVISYSELDESSDRMADDLKAHGVKSGDILPITESDPALWITTFLGILKAEASFVSISSSIPEERKAFILTDINTSLAGSDAFGIYYTSGSTGNPKGVILSHMGIMSFCKMHVSFCRLSHGIKSGVQSDPGFDSFILAVMPILYVGGTLYMMNSLERMSLIGIHKFLMKNKIDITFLTTQLATEYMRSFDNKYLTTLLTGGEALRSYTPRSYKLYNLYGPTECTVYVCGHLLCTEDSGDIPIGKPTGDNRILVLDDELCVSGPQLALGYLNRPEETAKKFIKNPQYDPAVDGPSYEMLYRTGDLVTLCDDGNILYRGRIDKQVKISGYRIEPDEIEIAMNRHPAVLAACVISKQKQNGDVALAAYFSSSQAALSHDILKDFLSETLPFYMIPHYFMQVESLPLDKRTCKVDLSALPEFEL